ncbi:TTAGGG binding factor [Sesbania bispinosa]|nr:TTAGGG binding factor [Sesbania bispinosa]
MGKTITCSSGATTSSNRAGDNELSNRMSIESSKPVKAAASASPAAMTDDTQRGKEKKNRAVSEGQT